MFTKPMACFLEKFPKNGNFPFFWEFMGKNGKIYSCFFPLFWENAKPCPKNENFPLSGKIPVFRKTGIFREFLFLGIQKCSPYIVKSFSEVFKRNSWKTGKFLFSGIFRKKEEFSFLFFPVFHRKKGKCKTLDMIRYSRNRNWQRKNWTRTRRR